MITLALLHKVIHKEIINFLSKLLRWTENFATIAKYLQQRITMLYYYFIFLKKYIKVQSTNLYPRTKYINIFNEKVKENSYLFYSCLLNLVSREARPLDILVTKTHKVILSRITKSC